MSVWDLDPEEERHGLADGIRNDMLQNNSPHTLAAENNEFWEKTKAGHHKKNVVHMIMERKLKLFEHICRMDDNRLAKNVVFGIMDGQNRRGRPGRECMDVINEWCRSDVNTLSIMAQDRSAWTGDELSLRHCTPTGASPWSEEGCRIHCMEWHGVDLNYL